MVDAADDELIDYRGVAALLGASSKTVYRLAQADPTFPKKIMLRSLVRFRRADVLAWIAAAGRPDQAE